MKSLVKVLLSLFTGICLVLGLNPVSISAQEVRTEFFSPEAISEMSQIYNVSPEYLERYNTTANIIDKLNLLEYQSKNDAKLRLKSFNSNFNKKYTVFIDESNIITISKTIKYDLADETHSNFTTDQNVTYTSSYNIGAGYCQQVIGYTRRMLNFNTYQASVYNVYGLYNGIAQCSVSSSWDKSGMGYHPWASTQFYGKLSFTDLAMTLSLSADSTYSSYDVWTTVWRA